MYDCFMATVLKLKNMFPNVIYDGTFFISNRKLVYSFTTKKKVNSLTSAHVHKYNLNDCYKSYPSRT